MVAGDSVAWTVGDSRWCVARRKPQRPGIVSERGLVVTASRRMESRRVQVGSNGESQATRMRRATKWVRVLQGRFTMERKVGEVEARWWLSCANGR
ncbi:hypothetical protein HN51_037467 [Arachis hypogaea]